MDPVPLFPLQNGYHLKHCFDTQSSTTVIGLSYTSFPGSINDVSHFVQSEVYSDFSFKRKPIALQMIAYFPNKILGIIYTSV